MCYFKTLILCYLCEFLVSFLFKIQFICWTLNCDFNFMKRIAIRLLVFRLAMHLMGDEKHKTALLPLMFHENSHYFQVKTYSYLLERKVWFKPNLWYLRIIFGKTWHQWQVVSLEESYHLRRHFLNLKLHFTKRFFHSKDDDLS